jgi:hypothetical protein
MGEFAFHGSIVRRDGEIMRKGQSTVDGEQCTVRSEQWTGDRGRWTVNTRGRIGVGGRDWGVPRHEIT